MRYSLLFIIILLLHISCETKVESSSDKFQILLPDTAKTHSANSLFDNLKDAGRQMKLPRIDTGVADFEIRLWQSAIFNPDLLIVIRKKDTLVECQSFYYDYKNGSIAKFEVTNLSRKGELRSLIDSLKKIDFPKLISQKEIEKFDDIVVDGIYYHLEISTSAYYKLLSYHCPEFYAKTDSDNKKFQDILLLIDRYISFYVPVCLLDDVRVVNLK